MGFTVLFFAHDEMIDAASFLTLEMAEAYARNRKYELSELQLFAGCGYVEIHRCTPDTDEIIYEHAI